MTGWALTYTAFDPAAERLREALCVLGNGYFATRGAAPEATAGPVHYPGTYLAGGYNRLQTRLADHWVENEDLVNLPNWLPLTFRIAEGAWFDLAAVTLLDFQQSLDLQRGVLERRLQFQDTAGRRSTLVQRRLVHLRYPHLAALETCLTAENWSGPLTVHSALDGRVVNGNVARYRDLSHRHLEPLTSDAGTEDTLLLQVRTCQSRLVIAQAATTRLFRGAERLVCAPTAVQETGYCSHSFALDMAEGDTLRIEKTVALYTSRDQAISEPALAAQQAVATAAPFAALLAEQALAWEQLWRRFAIDLRVAAPEEQRTVLILRLHLFHLLQTASVNSIELDVGIPARGWHGEAYRGHVFWDELFIFPLLNLRLPEITRALLKYRYRRLPAARRLAREAGWRGAMYPWQSGSDGREESQALHLNPQSGRWLPDRSRLQRHVNAAIAYNIWHYYQVTDDQEFMAFYGAEMLLEIARFWASLARYNPALGRYEITGVMGPDEYHEAYPDAVQGGLNNNAYTNVMAVWVLARALDLLHALPAERRQSLQETLRLDADELALWEDVSRRMRIVFHGDGLISQFEGYEQLREFDWSGYRARYGTIQRLDRLLESEGDSPNRYQVSKQADVLMLFYLFSAEELEALFQRLGYPFDPEMILRNIAYYSPRTAHGSTLSRVVHSWVLARSDRPGSWALFREALHSDIDDIQGGTTAEGIHLGAMAGTVDLVQRGYLGIVTQGDVLWFNPCLPDNVVSLSMCLHYRGHTLALTVTDNSRLRLRCEPCLHARPIRIGFRDQVVVLNSGETREFSL